MDWEGPRTQPSFWTPSIPPLERRLATNSLPTQLYRALRLCWVALTLPTHLLLVVLSLTPLALVLPAALVPGKKQRWTPPQRLVYPLLRRLIWAVCDVGAPGALTPSEARNVPLWAWALEEFTVRVGRGARVCLDVRDAALPQQARDEGWVTGDVVDHVGVIEFETVPCFWFEREGEERTAVAREGEDRWRASHEDERVIVYFVGGGFVTGNPTEGSRCFKLARETGLRVVSVNFRKATTPSQAFPAALQDALAVYAHLVFTLGYRDILLAGDSAGGCLALMLTQYLASLPPSPSLVLPSALLLYSPWSDLTASTYARAAKSDFEDDIICASMATNSIRAFLRHVHSPAVCAALAKRGGAQEGSVYQLGARHPFFAPALDDALPALLFHLEVLRLAANLRAASRAAAVDAGSPGAEPLVVEVVSEEGEVHAFPLVPEWVSPAAGRAMRRVRGWAVAGMGTG
ncbi:hypothetical protein JCM10450v2_002092 [Rhodotorula kratochvilovae]